MREYKFTLMPTTIPVGRELSEKIIRLDYIPSKRRHTHTYIYLACKCKEKRLGNSIALQTLGSVTAGKVL